VFSLTVRREEFESLIAQGIRGAALLDALER
jgi:hypothetical protein